MQELTRQLAEYIVDEVMSAEADEACTAVPAAGTATGSVACRRAWRCRCPGSQAQERELLPGRRDRALAPAVVETCATGTSARKARRIAEGTGVGRLSKDQAGAIARSLDADAAEPLGRDLSGYRMSYLWLDATCVRRLRGGRMASAAVPGPSVVDAEPYGSWLAFLGASEPAAYAMPSSSPRTPTRSPGGPWPGSSRSGAAGARRAPDA
jgi:putative transposase